MYIDPKSAIAGLPALKIRDLLRKIGDRSVTPEFIADRLGLEEAAAAALARDLVAKGYLEEDETVVVDAPLYKATLLGSSLALASAAAPLTRKTAKRKLDQFMSRVREINTNPYYLYRVKKVVLFGSYLGGGRERMNDIDLAVELGAKHRKEAQRALEERRREEAWEGGRNFSNFVEVLCWPETEVLKFLKCRSRAISLHRTSDGILGQVEQKVIYDEDEHNAT